MDGCDYETYPNLQSEKGEKKATGNYCLVNITPSHNNYIYVFICSIYIIVAGE